MKSDRQQVREQNASAYMRRLERELTTLQMMIADGRPKDALQRRIAAIIKYNRGAFGSTTRAAYGDAREAMGARRIPSRSVDFNKISAQTDFIWMEDSLDDCVVKCWLMIRTLHQSKQLNITSAAKVAGKVFGIAPEDVLGTMRTLPIFLARAIMTRCLFECGWNITRIYTALNSDHRSVRNALSRTLNSLEGILDAKAFTDVRSSPDSEPKRGLQTHPDAKRLGIAELKTRRAGDPRRLDRRKGQAPGQAGEPDRGSSHVIRFGDPHLRDDG